MPQGMDKTALVVGYPNGKPVEILTKIVDATDRDSESSLNQPFSNCWHHILISSSKNKIIQV
jgi:hypothetical protein